MNSSPGFTELYKLRDQPGHRFADLLDAVASEAPDVRFRFTSPHPKDFPLPVLEAIKAHKNICKQVHMPAQSGNDRILSLMRRNYSRQAYLELTGLVRQVLPGVALSSDFIAGFCSETQAEFEDTLSLISHVRFDLVVRPHQGFMFAYSMREKTHAHRNLQDDVPEPVKQQRLAQMIDHFLQVQLQVSREEIGRYHLVLVDGPGKKPNQLKGKTDTYRTTLFDCSAQAGLIRSLRDVRQPEAAADRGEVKKGDYVLVKVTDCSPTSLKGQLVGKVEMNRFFELSAGLPFFTLAEERLL